MKKDNSIGPTPKGLNVYEKLLRVMEQVGRVEKKGYYDFHKYNYVLEADLIEAVRSSLIEAGVFIKTSIESQEHVGQLTTVRTKHTFINAEDPMDACEVSGVGQGQDSGDKGGYKAITGAMKYFLMKNFLIATGDDPENDEGIVKTELFKKDEPKKIIVTPIKREEPVEIPVSDEKQVVKLSSKELSMIKPITNLLKNAETKAEMETAKIAAGAVKESLSTDQIKYLTNLFIETEARLK